MSIFFFTLQIVQDWKSKESQRSVFKDELEQSFLDGDIDHLILQLSNFEQESELSPHSGGEPLSPVSEVFLSVSEAGESENAHDQDIPSNSDTAKHQPTPSPSNAKVIFTSLLGGERISKAKEGRQEIQPAKTTLTPNGKSFRCPKPLRKAPRRPVVPEKALRPCRKGKKRKIAYSYQKGHEAEQKNICSET